MCSSDLDLDKDNLPIEKALGLQWCVESDNFQFNINLSQKPHPGRVILSVVSSIFDPLGFLAPLTLPAKQLLQGLCQRGFGWDEPLPQPVSEKWMEWTNSLDRIKGFSVPRCLKPKGYGMTSCAVLHHFADASESDYGSVCPTSMPDIAGNRSSTWPIFSGKGGPRNTFWCCRRGRNGLH